MTKSRILIEVTKNTVRIVDGIAGHKIVSFPKAGQLAARAFRQEDGGAGAAFSQPNAGHINTSAHDASPLDGATDTDIINLRGTAIELTEELAERLNRYVHFKDRVAKASSNDGDGAFDLRGLNYDGSAAGSADNCLTI
jgi:hypothetical protein